MMRATLSRRRVLVDECVSRLLLTALTDCALRTVQEMGWSGIKNGSLLELAVQEFEVIFTVDRTFAGLGDTLAMPIGIVILQPGSTDFEALLPHMAAVNKAIQRMEPGKVVRIP